jgi:CheY-like chemotaxis protein
MSHELRTPLNSILVLGQQLGDNADGNLTSKQVEFARTIHGAGTDLLNLITDILDLSKIESGTVSVQAAEVVIADLLETVVRPFRHEAERRRLDFTVETDPHLAQTLVTDSKRVQQVLKNLLSNAFKFTEQGSVRISVSLATRGWSEDHPVLGGAGSAVAFEVADTGIGIPIDKQRIIFEAFQQADAGTSRKYGGTGLGLAISRELAGLLGGEIQLLSAPGKGSTFTLYLPHVYAEPAASVQPSDRRPFPPAHPIERPQERVIERVPDDRENLLPGDEVLLIVEDDRHYARLLADLSHDKGLKVLVATTGAEALALTREHRPTAVSLDVFLPDMLGWTVLNHLKQDPATRHIPVQMLTLDEDRNHGLACGAFAFMNKPATHDELGIALERIKEYTAPRRKRLLIVEDNPAEQLSVTTLLDSEDIEIVVSETGSAALAMLAGRQFDCVVLDLRLPDMSGFDVLERLRDDPALRDLPVVVFTGRELSPEEDARLHMLTRSVVVKGVESPERLLDETALFLHRVVGNLPEDKQRMLERLYRSDDALAGKKVLVVDDDVRNIFALSSVLERRGMTVLTAGTGREAIETLDSTPDVSIILMDIMMPEMDGYETMRVIRQNPVSRRLPIISLTAKAMKGDREKCLEAGASEYLAKPVNTEQLLSVLRSWLHR